MTIAMWIIASKFSLSYCPITAILWKDIPNSLASISISMTSLIKYTGNDFSFGTHFPRVLLGGRPNGSTVANYALFQWHVRRNYALAANCFKIAIQLSPDKAYYYANFLGRHAKDEENAKEMLLNSKVL